MYFAISNLSFGRRTLKMLDPGPRSCVTHTHTHQRTIVLIYTVFRARRTWNFLIKETTRLRLAARRALSVNEWSSFGEISHWYSQRVSCECFVPSTRSMNRVFSSPWDLQSDTPWKLVADTPDYLISTRPPCLLKLARHVSRKASIHTLRVFIEHDRLNCFDDT